MPLKANASVTREAKQELVVEQSVKATLTRRVTNLVEEVTRAGKAAASAVVAAAAVAGAFAQTHLQRHGPIAGVAEEAVHEAGDKIAFRIVRRATHLVKRTRTFGPD